MPRLRVSATERLFIASQQKWACDSCGKLLDSCFEIDHRTPIGMPQENPNCSINLHALCLTCHREKTLGDVRAMTAYRKGSTAFSCPRCGQTISVFMSHACAPPPRQGRSRIHKPATTVPRRNARLEEFFAPAAQQKMEDLFTSLQYRAPLGTSRKEVAADAANSKRHTLT